MFPSYLGSGVVSRHISVLSRFRFSIMSYFRPILVLKQYHIIFPSSLSSGVVSHQISVLSRFRSSSYHIVVLSRSRSSITLHFRPIQVLEQYHIIFPSYLGSGVVSYYVSVLSRFRSSITSYIRPVQGSGLVSHHISVLSLGSGLVSYYISVLSRFRISIIHRWILLRGRS